MKTSCILSFTLFTLNIVWGKPERGWGPNLLVDRIKADVQPKSSIPIGAKVKINPQGLYIRTQG
jgi:hypothetical protein